MDIPSRLRALDLQEYERVFRENAIDEAVFLTLTAEDLRELGLPLGHRKRLLASLNSAADAKPPASAPLPAKAERRILTVLFGDLASSTELSTRLDAEDLRTVIGAYCDQCKLVIESFGGYVAKFLGDGVLAYFGYPNAHEDDAERAILAGLALADEAGAIRVPPHVLRTRVGIATGEVVVGDLIGGGSSSEAVTFGETNNMAARLQAIAEPGSVVIAEATRRLTGRLFEYRDLGCVAVKGFATPMQAWRPLGAGVYESRFAALRASETPLVGRGEELELALRRWAAARSGGGRVIMVTGEPGIGKSRFVAAVEHALEGEAPTRLRLSCSPLHTDSPMFPVIEYLGRACGFEHTDTPEQRLAKLGAVLEPIGTKPDSAALIADMLSLPTGEALANMAPRRRKEGLMQALVAQVMAMARTAPLLLVCEDLQWIDPTTRELLDMLVDWLQDAPALLMLTFRPEFTPPWSGQAHTNLITLTRLERVESASLVASIAGRVLPAEIVNQILARSDGVPLFIEEFAKATIETIPRDLARDDLAGRAPSEVGISIPSSLQQSLMARLDRLSPVRELIQLAAVIGREFQFPLLQALSGQTESRVAEAMETLVKAGLVLRRGEPPFATYTFKHGLVQNAAYETLLRSRRQALHTRVAELIQKLFPEVSEQEPGTLAWHLSRGQDPSRAIEYLIRAARRSASRHALPEAVAPAKKALALIEELPDGAARDMVELDAASLLASALAAWHGASSSETARAYGRARGIAERLGDYARLFPLLSGLCSSRMQLNEVPEAFRLAEEMLRLAEERQDVTGLLVSNRSLGCCYFLRGDFTAAERCMQAALALYEPGAQEAVTRLAGWDMRANALGMSGLDLFCLGFPDHSRARGLEAIAWSWTVEHPFTQSFVLQLAARRELMGGEWARAETHLREAAEVAGRHGFTWYIDWIAYMRSVAQAEQSSASETLAMLDEHRAIIRANDRVNYMRSFKTTLSARVFWRAGLLDEAQAFLSDAADIASRCGEGWYEPEILRFNAEFMQTYHGDTEGAALALRRAVSIARQQKARMWELRSLTALCQLGLGGSAERAAQEELAGCLDWFTEGFDSSDLQKARAVLIAPH